VSLALVEPATAPAEIRANPVRMGAARSGRIVHIAYTDFAQVKTRTHTLFGSTDEEVAKAILTEAGLAPRDVKVKTQQLGDVAVLRRMPVTMVEQLLPDSIQPIAFVDGLTTDELAGALAALANVWPQLT
jgi:hypothetical protein